MTDIYFGFGFIALGVGIAAAFALITGTPAFVHGERPPQNPGLDKPRLRREEEQRRRAERDTAKVFLLPIDRSE